MMETEAPTPATPFSKGRNGMESELIAVPYDFETPRERPGNGREDWERWLMEGRGKGKKKFIILTRFEGCFLNILRTS